MSELTSKDWRESSSVFGFKEEENNKSLSETGLASSVLLKPSTRSCLTVKTCQKLIPEPKSISHNYARSCYASILAYLLTWCDISFVEEGKKLKLNGGDFLAKGDQFCYSIFLLSFQITAKLWHSHNWVNEIVSKTKLVY